MPLQKWRFTVPPEDAVLRLDQLVAKHTGLSRRQAREALSLGGVQVDRSRVKVAGKLIKPGREVTVAFDENLGDAPMVDIPVVFEDPWLLAVNKPAGLPTQGTWATDQHDLIAMLRRQRPDLKLYLHHRLDQPTSGLLLFSKAAEANKGLTAQFEGRDLIKLYLARISEPLDACTVDEPIGRVRHANPGRFGCSGDLIDPRPAKTDFRPATEDETRGLAPGAWVVARLHSGRTHQIRVHLAHLGHPILGDSLYGGASNSQLWLHAWRLGLTHPVTGEAIQLEAPPLRFQEPQG
jgi:23S rRNA pseudouridine1911/1915/1917 synthase